MGQVNDCPFIVHFLLSVGIASCILAMYMFIRGLILTACECRYGMGIGAKRSWPDSNCIADFWIVMIPYLLVYFLLHKVFRPCHSYGRSVGLKCYYLWMNRNLRKPVGAVNGKIIMS